jgi:hypothetical protein
MAVGPMERMPSVPHWHRGRMVLVGDSAHAPSSSSGQGASQAIESAIELARCLRDLPTPAAAFTAHEHLRRSRVEMIGGNAAATNRAKAGQAGHKPAMPPRADVRPRPPPPHQLARDRGRRPRPRRRLTRPCPVTTTHGKGRRARAGCRRHDPSWGARGRTLAEELREALALERPAMTSVRGQLGDRLRRQLAHAYQQRRHPSSGRGPTTATPWTAAAVSGCPAGQHARVTARFVAK